MRTMNQLLPVVMALTLTASASAAAAPVDPKKTRDVCVVDVSSGFPLNYFVFRDVEPLTLNQPLSLKGLYFVPSRLPAPLHGSAVLISDGSVRIGFFVHSTATPTADPNDFTMAGKTDSNFVGLVTFDNDGDFKPNGTLDLRTVDCSTVNIP
jgi:hypothetical protein